MKVAIVNPYLDTLGGGERYTMAVASALVKAGYSVEVQWKEKNIRERLEARFGIKLDGVEIVDDVGRGDGYDVCFWVSDGSIPTLKARNNILHFQFPFRGVKGKTLLNRMKLARINEVVCNSEFTKKIIDEEYGVKSKVIYPPVDTEKFRPKRKENLMIGIGRFSQLTQSKGQDVLVEVFKKFYDKGNRDWRLVLAGGVEVGVDDYVQKLRETAEGYPIEILESPDFKILTELYGKAKIFASASGYGVDVQKDPTRVEHFGITVVEAMSAKAVPVIYGAGGHREIVVSGENGYLWRRKSELMDRLTELAENGKKLNQLSIKAKEDSTKYSYEIFYDQVLNLL